MRCGIVGQRGVAPSGRAGPKKISGDLTLQKYELETHEYIKILWGSPFLNILFSYV